MYNKGGDIMADFSFSDYKGTEEDNKMSFEKGPNAMTETYLTEEDGVYRGTRMAPNGEILVYEGLRDGVDFDVKDGCHYDLDSQEFKDWRTMAEDEQDQRMEEVCDCFEKNKPSDELYKEAHEKGNLESAVKYEVQLQEFNNCLPR